MGGLSIIPASLSLHTYNSDARLSVSRRRPTANDADRRMVGLEGNIKLCHLSFEHQLQLTRRRILVGRLGTRNDVTNTSLLLFELRAKPRLASRFKLPCDKNKIIFSEQKVFQPTLCFRATCSFDSPACLCYLQLYSRIMSSTHLLFQTEAFPC